MNNVIALIMAAGSGNRAGGDTPKQYQPLLGRRVIDWSLALCASRASHTYVVTAPDDDTTFDQAKTIPGGKTRQESVRLALEFLKKNKLASDQDIVLIHDAARPCLSRALLNHIIAAAEKNGTAIPMLPVVDTLRHIDNASGASRLQSRDGLHAAQTPQGFRFGDIQALHQKYAAQAVTDDAALFELDGKKLHFCTGDADNIKITYPGDLTRAEAILSQRLGDIRTGKGFDVHRLIPASADRPLMLGGIAVPHDMTLEGHSDADVALHAVTDAILGALCAGDIGLHFSPADPRWKNAASHLFLRHAADMVRARDGAIAHVDLTLLCETPKISPHRDAMRQKIADILALPVSRVSVKATTTEKLGFTGRKEGIAAEAVATLRLPFSPVTESIAA